MRFESRAIPFNLLLVAGCVLTTTSCQAEPRSSASINPEREAVTAPAGPAKVVSPVSVASTAAAASVAAKELPPVLVHKSASCGCCGAWVDHLRDAGFIVRVNETEDMNPIKERLGVPYGKGSCHTAEVGGYMVEGHVPAGDIKRLLLERPQAKGLVLPGMPIGSPGMEVPDGTVEPYTVELVSADGQVLPFAQHGR
jgi:hypothetical protein